MVIFVETFHSMEELQLFMNEDGLRFIYVMHSKCSVCHDLFPQVKEILQLFPDIHVGKIQLDDVPETAGFLSVFTVPVLLLYINGKETIRVARFVHLNELQEKIARVYHLFTNHINETE